MSCGQSVFRSVHIDCPIIFVFVQQERKRLEESLVIVDILTRKI